MSEWQDFKDYQLQTRIKEFWAEAQTGILSCEVRGYEKALFWKEGVVLFASSNDPDDKLPQILIGQGCFTEDQYESVLPNFKDELSIGRNLVEMGLISQQELVQGAREQVYKIFEGVIKASDGRFSFSEDNLPQGIVSLPLSFPRDIFRAILALEDKTWLSEHFDDLDFICEQKAENPINFQEVQVADYAEEVYGLIDGELDFNHLVFEAGIDEFALLKFLYALEIMDHITFIRPESQSQDEMQEADDFDDTDAIDDVRDELSQALSQDDEISRLGTMSMDETIDLPSSMLRNQPIVSPEDELPAMDTTMEMPKSEMGFDEDILEDRLGEETSELDAVPEPFDDEAGGWAEADDDFPMEDEEAGLDDLSSADDILEQELKRMAEPLNDMEDYHTGAIADDEDGEEPEEAEEGSDGKVVSRKRLLFLVAILAAVSGLAIALYFQDWFGSKPLNPEEELAHFPPSNNVEEPVEDPTTDTAAANTPTNDPSSQALVQNDSASIEDLPVDSPEIADLPEDNLEAAQASTEAAPIEEKTPPSEQVKDSKPEQDPETEFISKGLASEPAPKEQGDKTTRQPVPPANDIVSPEMRGFHSPLADGWEQNASQSPAKILEVNTDAATDNTVGEEPTPSESNLTKSRAEAEEKKVIPMTELKDATPSVKEETSPVKQEPEKVATRNPPAKTKVPKTNVPTQNALKTLMAEGNYREAAQGWAEKQKTNGEQFTIALFMGCETTSLSKAIAEAGGNDNLFILPKKYKGKACYWVCWGNYSSRMTALREIKSLPITLEEPPEVTKLKLLE